ncbi:MAG: hypothetical protein KAU03_04905 [Candidatus Altiarchaeales archaeon]|nr:hypothetical protein [Candidatus Altiarchaeales archaeon]
MDLMRFLRDERGIETRVLVFILAAIILVLLIAMVTDVMDQARGLIDLALGQAEKSINATNSTT